MQIYGKISAELCHTSSGVVDVFVLACVGQPCDNIAARYLFRSDYCMVLGFTL